MRKMALRREVVRVLASRDLANARGGVDTGSGVGCVNTLQVCVDTQAVTNCNCGPSAPYTWACPLASAMCSP